MKLTDTIELTPPILAEMSFRFNRLKNADLFFGHLASSGHHPGTHV